MDKKLNFTKQKLTNKKASSILKNILPTTPLMENKLTSPKKDNKIITLLPIKYKILLYILFSFSSFFMYLWLKETIKFKYNVSEAFFSILLVFSILYCSLLFIFKKKINTTSIIKVGVLYSLCISILSCYAFYYLLDLKAHCHFTPTEVLRHGYPKCYDKVKEYYKFYFIIYYNLFVIFQTTAACMGLLFTRSHCFSNEKKYIYSYSLILVFITIIIAFIYCIFTSK